MGTYGPLARSIEDLRLCLSIIEGPHEQQAALTPVAERNDHPRPLPDLRVAWTDRFDGAPVSRETQAAIRELAEKLKGAGCRLERRDPPSFDFEAAWRTWGELVGGEQGCAMPLKLRLLFG